MQLLFKFQRVNIAATSLRTITYYKVVYVSAPSSISLCHTQLLILYKMCKIHSNNSVLSLKV